MPTSPEHVRPDSHQVDPRTNILLIVLAAGSLQVNLGADSSSYTEKGRCSFAGWLRDDSRLASFPIITNVGMKRNVSKKVNVMILTQLLYSLVRSKDVSIVMAVGAVEQRHILHQA